MSSAKAAPATSEAMIRALNLREEPQLQRQLNIIRPVVQAELLLDSLLVGIDGLRADEQPLTDLRRRVSLSDELEDVLLALGQLVETLALRSGRVFLREILRGHTSRGHPHVDVAVGDGAYCIDQLAVRRALHQISGRAGL